MTDHRKQIEMYRSSDRWDGPQTPIAEEVDAVTMIGQERMEITIMGEPTTAIQTSNQELYNLEDLR